MFIKFIHNSVLNKDALAGSNDKHIYSDELFVDGTRCTILRGFVSLMGPSIEGEYLKRSPHSTLARHAGVTRVEKGVCGLRKSDS